MLGKQSHMMVRHHAVYCDGISQLYEIAALVIFLARLVLMALGLD